MNSRTRTLLGVLGLANALTFFFVVGKSAFGDAVLFFVLSFAAGAIYFVPSIIAFEKLHSNALPIFVVNLLLGWSGIGWIGALIWSLTRDRAAEILEVQERDRKRGMQAAPVVPDTAVLTARLPRVLSDTIAEPNAKATKTCPFCAEQVLQAAIKCKHCGSDLSGNARAANH